MTGHVSFIDPLRHRINSEIKGQGFSCVVLQGFKIRIKFNYVVIYIYIYHETD
jgi:hypothetical protein